MKRVSRRDAVLMGASVTLYLSVGNIGAALATPAEADAEIAKFTGGKEPREGKITIDLPEIAENGNTIPLAITVDAPMTAESYVSDILVVADGNPNPGIAKFQLSPLSGRAEAGTRIRLATTENVIVVAKTSDGKFYTDRKQVKVTIGGCGG
jgi:sulfur-oxidizing protein SoxY